MRETPSGRPEGPHPCLCFNMRQAARRLSAFYDGQLARTGLTAAQFSLLAEIASGAGAHISDIADRLGLDPSTLSRTLRPLETSGLVALIADPNNRRLKRVSATSEGRGRLRQAMQAWQTAQAAAMAAIPEGLVQAVLEGAGRLPQARSD